MTSGSSSIDQSTTVVIFGASGDLTQRKLIPSLCSLFCKDRLGPEVNIVGMARSNISTEEFRASLTRGIDAFEDFSPDTEELDQFLSRVHYHCGDASLADDLKGLEGTLLRIESSANPANRLYYLALAPSLYEPAILNLGAAGLANAAGAWRRVIIEKPFGSDLASAQALNKSIHSVFTEDQVFRIDHYLGKETVQNLLVLRFANTIFEPVWNRNYINNVQITVSETVDLGERAGYYEQAGVFRDMFQNHLLQLLTVVAMEPPPIFRQTCSETKRSRS